MRGNVRRRVQDLEDEHGGGGSGGPMNGPMVKPSGAAMLGCLPIEAAIAAHDHEVKGLPAPTTDEILRSAVAGEARFFRMAPALVAKMMATEAEGLGHEHAAELRALQIELEEGRAA